ncbi:polysaccharide deacetylase family protein, PEP-CTERM locus subfamily [Nitrosomonas marina]|uniref:Polysaccharide deacetylase family protein, PEP-CTERM locus subfamily n=1 Tax=Nitrosomonas marina TaxID=917 RepID=A0A1H9Y1Q5_9PROT|nr:XrtA system polysaccharide deacetylase [Nitrosomonas marina]SES62575.1 polysaccharide deacetylase family protein, PEP-CTERM locus subfamily [Nitrosomonas marina]
MNQINTCTLIKNAMTIDVEDYFQVSAFEKHIPRSSWDSIPCRVEHNIEKILGLLDEKQIKATFFTLGWIAERYPQMIKRMSENGHEIASHGWGHARVTDLTPSEFKEDIIRSKAVLEEISSRAVVGYRAPSFSINRKNLWALDCLAEAGYRYSSSIYPVQHDHYGMPDAPRFAYFPRGESGVLELPVTTVRLWGRNVPAGGGGYFRLWPYTVSKWFIKRLNGIESHAAIFYFHPWEIDVDQPRQQGVGFKTRFRHYLNLHRMEKRLRALIHDFQWDRVDKIFLN